VFIATQLNSTRRRVELSCVAINGPLAIVCVSVCPSQAGIEWTQDRAVFTAK